MCADVPVPSSIAVGSARALGMGVYAVRDDGGMEFVLKLECRPLLNEWRGAQAWADTVVSEIADVGGFEHVQCTRPCVFRGANVAAEFPASCLHEGGTTVAGACAAFIKGMVYGRPPLWVGDVLTARLPAASLPVDMLTAAHEVSSLLVFDFLASNFDRVNAENWVRVDGHWFAMDNGLAWWHSGLCRPARDTSRYLARPPVFETHVHRRRRAAMRRAAAAAAVSSTAAAAAAAPESDEFCVFSAPVLEGVRRLAAGGVGLARLRVALETNPLLALLESLDLPTFTVPGFWQASLPIVDLAPYNATCRGSVLRAVDGCAGLGPPPATLVDMLVASVSSQAQAVLDHVDACTARLGVERTILPPAAAAAVAAAMAVRIGVAAPRPPPVCALDPRVTIETPRVAPPRVLLPLRVRAAALDACSGADGELRAVSADGGHVLSARFQLTRGVAVEVFALNGTGAHTLHVQLRCGGAGPPLCGAVDVIIRENDARFVWAGAAAVPAPVPRGTIVIVPAGATLAAGGVDVDGTADMPVVFTTLAPAAAAARDGSGEWGGLVLGAGGGGAASRWSHTWFVGAGSDAAPALEVGPRADFTMTGGGFVDCGGWSTLHARPGARLALRRVAIFRCVRSRVLRGGGDVTR